MTSAAAASVSSLLASLPPALVAGAAAALAAAFLAGLAYVFQPALEAHRSRQLLAAQGRRYTFPVYAGKGKKEEKEEAPFPTLEGEPSVLLSLVVPAYNEEARLPVMLDETLAYLEKWRARDKALTYEVVVVDDGSKDGTCGVVRRYSQEWGSERVRLLRLGRNRGKGGALREGMLHTRGRYALMVDADGATDITCLEKLLARTRAAEAPCPGLGGAGEAVPVAVGIGSRAHYEKDSVATRAWYRTVLMKGLHVLVSLLISARIRDTQCGFKLFTRGAVKVLFGTLHLERWGFDLEIVHLCDRLALPMAEVAVNWEEVPGSKLIQRKVDVVLASLGIFRDMLCVRLCYLLGLWSTKPWTRQGLWGDANTGKGKGNKGNGSGAAPLRRSPRKAGGQAGKAD